MIVQIDIPQPDVPTMALIVAAVVLLVQGLKDVQRALESHGVEWVGAISPRVLAILTSIALAVYLFDGAYVLRIIGGTILAEAAVGRWHLLQGKGLRNGSHEDTHETKGPGKPQTGP